MIKLIRRHLINRLVTTFHFHDITTQDVMCIISKLPNKKRTGHDGISTETIKILSAVISPTLSLIINKYIITGTVPDDMKVLKFKPLFKKGDMTLLNNREIDRYLCCRAYSKFLRGFCLINYMNTLSVLIY